MNRLVGRDALLEKIADGFMWVEGPVWHRTGGDAPFPGREPGSNGLAFDPVGRLLLAEHGDRRIARLEADGRKTTLVDRYEGRRLNRPNDLVFSSKGELHYDDARRPRPGHR